MANHLQRIVFILPPEKTEALRKLPIRIDLEHKLTSMQYHPSKQWLTANGHDPSLEKRVHVPRASSLLARGTWAKHPYVILHELAHAYHDRTDHGAGAIDRRRITRCHGCLSRGQCGLDTVISQPRQRRQRCLLYTSPSPRDQRGSRMPSSA